MQQSQFTDKAKTALILADKCAKSFHQNYVGTEHILLGLLRENTGVAAFQHTVLNTVAFSHGIR